MWTIYAKLFATAIKFSLGRGTLKSNAIENTTDAWLPHATVIPTIPIDRNQFDCKRYISDRYLRYMVVDRLLYCIVKYLNLTGT